MEDIREMLKKVAAGELSVDNAVLELKKEPFTAAGYDDLGFAKLDTHRKLRQGAAEVIYGAGKTPGQIAGIVEAMKKRKQETILITRVDEEKSRETEQLLAELYPTGSGYQYFKEAKVAICGSFPEKDGVGTIVVATGGVSYRCTGSTGEGHRIAAMLGHTVTPLTGSLVPLRADGCAELWSTEIDGLEERAFVASAAGEWLTRVCADRGVERRAGEDDETLRSRALESLKRQGASGNADDYAAWCGTVEGLLRVRVLPLARGAGTVDIVAVGQDGRAASAAAVAAAQSVVDEKRPIGADAKVFAAVEKPLNIAASVVLSEGASLEGAVNAFKGVFTAFCREGALTTRLVSYARVSAILLDQEGVADVTAFTLGGAGTSFALGEREIGVPGTVTLTDVTA